MFQKTVSCKNTFVMFFGKIDLLYKRKAAVSWENWLPFKVGIQGAHLEPCNYSFTKCLQMFYKMLLLMEFAVFYTFYTHIVVLNT